MFIFTIILALSGILSHHAMDLKPIVLHEEMTNYNIEQDAKIYYEAGRNENINTIQWKWTSFESYSRDKVPGKYVRGKYTNWIALSVKNPTRDTFFLCLNADLSKDSIWVFQEGKMIFATMNARPAEKDNYGIINARQRYFRVLAIPDSGVYEIVIKDYQSQYKIGSNIPTLSNAYLFEADYNYRNIWVISIFEGGIAVFITLILIFGFQAITTKDKSMLWYVFYLFSCLVITFRNLETFNVHLHLTTDYLSWTDTRVFHTALIFFAYIRFLQEILDIRRSHRFYPIFKYVYAFIATSVVIELGLYLFPFGNEYHRFINYQVLRTTVTIIGLLSLSVISGSGFKYARGILVGVIIMLLAESVSWFFGGYVSSIISLMGIYLELIIFSLVLSMKSRDYLLANTALKHHNDQLEIKNISIAREMESRISKDLHDDIGGALVSIKYLLLKGDSDKSSIEKSKILVDEIQDNIRQHVFLLNPENRQLTECLYELRKTMAGYCQAHNIEFEYEAMMQEKDSGHKIKGTSIRNIFLILKELFNNTLKHSRSDRIRLSIKLSEEYLTIQYADNGMANSDVVAKTGNGLKNIRKRVAEEGGKVSTRIDNGWQTTLTFQLDDILEIDFPRIAE